jgi:hypothetical protein
VVIKDVKIIEFGALEMCYVLLRHQGASLCSVLQLVLCVQNKHFPEDHSPVAAFVKVNLEEGSTNVAAV